MSMIKHEVPASLRKPMETSQLAPAILGRKQRMTQMRTSEVQAGSAMKAGISQLPVEPEDANMTGVTRSLNRRLLALNVTGSLLRRPLVA
jgi:hypothetical protein